MSSGLATLHRVLKGNYISFFYLYLLTFAPVLLSAEGMYRQGIGQIGLLFILINFFIYLRNRSLLYLSLSILFLCFSLFSHKSILFISPSILIALIACISSAYLFQPIARLASKLLIRYKPFLYLFIFLVSTVMILIYSIIGPLILSYLTLVLDKVLLA